MRIIFTALLDFALLATASTIKRTTERRPYHRIRNEFDHLVTDHFIIKLEEDHSLESHFAYIGKNFSQHPDADFRYMDLLHGYTVRVKESFMHDYIRLDPGVEYVQHNSAFDPHHGWRNETSTSILNEVSNSVGLEKRWKTVWNDFAPWPLRHLNWWIKSGAPRETDGYPVAVVDRAGEGVDCYVFDNGILLSHEAWLKNPRGSVSRFRRRFSGDPTDVENMHGTPVAGAIHDIVPYANIIDVHCLGERTYATDVVEALEEVIKDHNGKKKNKTPGWKGSIINMSFEAQDDRSIKLLIKKAIQAGIPVVTSAGNTGKDYGGLPCSWPDVICVGASDRWHQKPSWSNWGKDVTLFAPGHDVSLPRGDDSKAWHWTSGTSFSAPYVVGVMAIFIGYEEIKTDAKKVNLRLKQNMHYNFIPYSPGTYANTGLNHPEKYARHPYLGPGRDELAAYEGMGKNDTSMLRPLVPHEAGDPQPVQDTHFDSTPYSPKVAYSWCNDGNDSKKYLNQDIAIGFASSFCKTRRNQELRHRATPKTFADAVIEYYSSGDTNMRVYGYQDPICYDDSNKSELINEEDCQKAMIHIIDECDHGNFHKHGGGANIFCQSYMIDMFRKA